MHNLNKNLGANVKMSQWGEKKKYIKNYFASSKAQLNVSLTPKVEEQQK